jgi:hypothetical protein
MSRGLFGILMLIVIVKIMLLVSATCPLCAAAAGAGVGVARYYNVDDSIVGLYLGAFVISVSLWFSKLLKKRGKVLPEFIIVLASFLLLTTIFYMAGLIMSFDMVRNMPDKYSIFGLGIFGIDKLLFGMIIGTLPLWLTFKFSEYIKRKRGKVLWPYQSISFMLIVLIVLSFVFWILTK